MSSKKLCDWIEAGDLAAARRALEAGASPNLTRASKLALFLGLQIRSPLIAAIRTRRRDLVELLLEAGADVEQADCGKLQPLALACMQRDLGIAELLLASGADVHGNGARSSPICHAAIRDDLQLVLLLLQRGARPNDVLQGAKVSQFHLQGDVLRTLVAAGGTATPDIQEMLDLGAERGDLPRPAALSEEERESGLTEYLFMFGYWSPDDSIVNARGFDQESCGQLRIHARTEEEALDWGHEVARWYVALLPGSGEHNRWKPEYFATWIEDQPDPALEKVWLEIPAVEVGEYPRFLQMMEAFRD